VTAVTAVTVMADDLGVGQVATLDPSGQLAVAARLGEHLRDAWQRATSAVAHVELSVGGYRPNGVVVCGMGGSAIGADVVKACLPELPVPFEVVRGYELPAWVSPRTLVLAVSYSGNTEETLSCVTSALARECRPVCVTSGGTLAALARERTLPLITVPAGHQPRAAIGYLVPPLGAAIEAAGLATGFGAQVEEAAALVSEITAGLLPEVDEARNQAKQLARHLHGRLPVAYGAGLTSVVARRCKSQLNENAKAVAFWAELPELDHNELVGWSGVDGSEGQLHAIFFLDAEAPAPLQRRVALTRELVERHAAGVTTLQTRGQTPLARVLSLTCVVDFTSLYLALLRGLDPAPVDVIEWLKRRMAGHEGAAPPGAARVP